MNAMTCAEAQAQLDLLAAGVCDAQTQQALEQHLRTCPVCSDQLAVSQGLQALLDIHLNQAGLERLRQRVEDRSQPARRPRLFTPTLRRVLAAAALVLIAVGLAIWLPSREGDTKKEEPQFALVVKPHKAMLLKLPKDDKPEALPPQPMIARGGVKEMREELIKAKREGKLPLPPVVNLDLMLENRGTQPVEIRLGDASAWVSLDMSSDKVIRIDVTGEKPPAHLQPRTLTLPAGDAHVLTIERLIAGTPEKLEYRYVTEPGDYDVTVSVRFTADGKTITVVGTPARVKIAP